MTDTNVPDFSGLRALFINCTLKRSPATSNTQALIDASARLMRLRGVEVDTIRLVDHDVATGTSADMREEGWPADAWPDEIWPRVRAADILIVASPIWLGEIGSITKKLIERLDAMSSETNDRGQFAYYGKVGGAIITGNEDGLKHCAGKILFSLQHIGFTIAPASDPGWIGAVGPGPSYLDEESGGPETDFTNRSLTFATYNQLHLASMLKRAGGIPAYGNVVDAWERGERWDYVPNPEGLTSDG
ncbi:multimeric flavodoxin WrbA [Agromyces flavus]|uniref:Multimeric flavodoxin WrbA n=1 Tax=Agromyces flavus TaxID=589382 RepID=A0A1H1ZMA1_9MICO|nr:flavodoxin family protein [Agromyces flavus]MCP2367162.1 multimeric flavodoxin WrbA [Agromyces flavus]GGI46279.1 flavodoxin [Agromyces flavus]SDT34814.1 Multimeric flavodoxin WrbA [Agromyces flavus]